MEVWQITYKDKLKKVNFFIFMGFLIGNLYWKNLYHYFKYLENLKINIFNFRISRRISILIKV